MQAVGRIHRRVRVVAFASWVALLTDIKRRAAVARRAISQMQHLLVASCTLRWKQYQRQQMLGRRAMSRLSHRLIFLALRRWQRWVATQLRLERQISSQQAGELEVVYALFEKKQLQISEHLLWHGEQRALTKHFLAWRNAAALEKAIAARLTVEWAAKTASQADAEAVVQAENEKENARQWAEVASQKLDNMIQMMGQVQLRAKKMDTTLEMYEEDIAAYHDALMIAQDEVDSQGAAREAKALAEGAIQRAMESLLQLKKNQGDIGGVEVLAHSSTPLQPLADPRPDQRFKSAMMSQQHVPDVSEPSLRTSTQQQSDAEPTLRTTTEQTIEYFQDIPGPPEELQFATWAFEQAVEESRGADHPTGSYRKSPVPSGPKYGEHVVAPFVAHHSRSAARSNSQPPAPMQQSWGNRDAYSERHHARNRARNVSTREF